MAHDVCCGGGIRTTDCDNKAHFNPDATSLPSNMIMALYCNKFRMDMAGLVMLIPSKTLGKRERVDVSLAFTVDERA